jgi:endoribonuclease Dicer
VSGGRETALQVTKALTLPLSHIDRWSDFGRKVLTPPPNFTAKLRPGTIAAIEKIIGHKFNRPHLLAQAMVSWEIDPYSAKYLMIFHRHTHLSRVMKSHHMSVLNLLETPF